MYRSNRPRKRGKALDLSIWRAALKDGRVWTKLGRVTQFEGEDSYYEWDSNGELLIDVELSGTQERCFCRYASPFGFWVIPPAGTEVIVGVPDGDLDADPVILGCISKNGISSLATAGKIVIAVPDGTQVEIRTQSGTAQALATKADVQAVRDALDGHAHTYIPGPSGTATTTLNPSVPSPTGTTVLKGQ